MNILVAFERSGILSNEFYKLGHNVISCDFQKSNFKNHYICNAFNLLPGEFDLIVAFYPCTYLTKAGLFRNKNNPKRLNKTIKALHEFKSIFDNPCKKICVENPAGYISTHWRKPDQYIDPYLFGDNELKHTGLWLKGLPKLKPTKVLNKPTPKYIDRSGKKRYFVESCSPGLNRSNIRSQIFPGIAQAMALQWGAL